MLDRVGPAAYRVFFGDGSRLDLLNDEAAMAAQLEAVEAGAAEGYRCGTQGEQCAARGGRALQHRPPACCLACGPGLRHGDAPTVQRRRA